MIHEQPRNPLRKLDAELSRARMAVAGKRFDESPEGFKDIESIKARIRHAKWQHLKAMRSREA